ncbi:FAD dependent oxidoreductase [Mycena crocata]|nr:FAD dependent oxidoreductase [Mycena crocata]
MPPCKTLIIGSGCFGLATAWELLHRGWTDVTVIDKATTLPAPDGASNDINRIVRSSYTDGFYTKLAQEAIHLWRVKSEWNDVYHESGVLTLGSRHSVDYAHESYFNDRDMGVRVVPLDNDRALQEVFPQEVHFGSIPHLVGFLNHDGGWVNAGQGISVLMSKILQLGGNIICGKTAVKQIKIGKKTTGVLCSDGTVFEADLVVLAAGPWTEGVFPNLPLWNTFKATGQCVAMIQLTPEQGEIYRKCPVVIDFTTGFYIFPPNEENIMKMAIHGAGYTHSIASDGVSTPRTITTDPETGLLIPRSDVKELRKGLCMMYPQLGDEQFIATRLCWYTDSIDDDWVIGYYPGSEKSLLIATGGSGHGYKFLPVIGKLVVDSIEDKLSEELSAKFAVDRSKNQNKTRAAGSIPQELVLKDLCTTEEL